MASPSHSSPGSGRPSPLVWGALVLLIGAALGLRLAYLDAFSDTPFGDRAIEDEEFYDAWAFELLDGRRHDGAYHMSPYPAWALAAVYAATGADADDPGRIRWARTVWASLVVLDLLLVVAFVRRRAGPAAALAGAALVALHAPGIFYVSSLLPVSLTITLTLAGLVLVDRAIDARPVPGAGLALLAGVSLGLLTGLRGNALLLVPLAAVAVALLRPDPGARGERSAPRGWSWSLVRGAALVLGTLVALAPATVHNLRHGEPLLLTWHGGQNLYIGNHPGATGLYLPFRPGRQAPAYERIDAVALAEEATGRSLRPSEVDAYWRDRALGFMVEEPGAYLRLLVRKLSFVLGDTEFPDAHDFYWATEVFPPLGILPGHSVLLVLAAVGTVVAVTTGRRRMAWLAGAGGALYLGSVALFFIFGRYRLPEVAFLAPLAGLGLVGIGPLLRAGTVRVRVVAVGAVVAALVVVSWPGVPREYGLASTWFNVGLIHEERGEAADAVDAYTRTATLNPRHTKAHRALARARLAAGDAEGALAAARSAIALDPTDPAPWVSAGEALLRLGRAEAAVGVFRGALEGHPGYGPAVNGLRRAQAALRATHEP